MCACLLVHMTTLFCFSSSYSALVLRLRLKYRGGGSEYLLARSSVQAGEAKGVHAASWKAHTKCDKYLIIASTCSATALSN